MSNHSENEKKPIYKKWWFWVLVVLVVFIIIGANNSDNNPNVTTSSTTDTNASLNTNTKQNTVVKVGEEITTKDTKITFISANDYTQYNSYSAPASGNKIIRAEFSFENISSSDISLGNLDCYADGEKREAYYSADDYKNPTLESLSSGKKLKAVVYYEVPSNAENITLEYETNVWTSEKIEFVIK